MRIKAHRAVIKRLTLRAQFHARTHRRAPPARRPQAPPGHPPLLRASRQGRGGVQAPSGPAARQDPPASSHPHRRRWAPDCWARWGPHWLRATLEDDCWAPNVKILPVWCAANEAPSAPDSQVPNATNRKGIASAQERHCVHCDSARGHSGLPKA